MTAPRPGSAADALPGTAPASHPSEELARGIVAALVASGVRDVVYCPGSRSAPLAYALDAAVRAGVVRAHVRLDERSAGFLALGLTRAGRPGDAPARLLDERKSSDRASDEGTPVARSGGWGESNPHPVPVAIVTTSGGAVAELHASVAEAHHSRLPLIVLSADRPAEMRAVGASQTTTQVGLFGPHVASTLDLPADTVADRSLAARIGRLIASAQGLPTGTPGPVHINAAFRDPLTPAGGSAAAPDFAPGPVPARVVASPARRVAWEDAVEPGLATVIIAGDDADPAAAEWARVARVPLLAEPSSGLAFSSERIPFQQTLLAGPLAAEVDQVVVTGRPTLSRPVSRLLARSDVRVVVADPSPAWTDVAGSAALVVPALRPPAAPSSIDPGATDEAGAAGPLDGDDRAYGPDGWRERWLDAAAFAGERIGKVLESAPLSVLGVARTIWERDERMLVLGASNSVRAADLVGSGGAARRVVSNRGLAGIDGTIATAIGVGLGTGKPVTCLLGDLSFLHDAGALALPADEAAPDLLLVVADDAGGGIFAGLEHGLAENAPTFDRWFATAQTTSIEGIARAHGMDYVEASSRAELAAVLVAPLAGIRICRVPCARPTEIASVRNASPAS